jgi:hypothetical protein
VKKSFEVEIAVILAIISFLVGIHIHGAIADCDKKVCPYTTPSPTPEPTPSPDNGGQDEQDTEVAFIYTT